MCVCVFAFFCLVSRDDPSPPHKREGRDQERRTPLKMPAWEAIIAFLLHERFVTI